MTLNGVIAFMLPYFNVTVVEDRPTMSAKYRLPVTFGQNGPTQQSHGLFATAKLLVVNVISYRFLRFRLLNVAQIINLCHHIIKTFKN